MKITIDILGALLREAGKLAAREGVTPKLIASHTRILIRIYRKDFALLHPAALFQA